MDVSSTKSNLLNKNHSFQLPIEVHILLVTNVVYMSRLVENLNDVYFTGVREKPNSQDAYYHLH